MPDIETCEGCLFAECVRAGAAFHHICWYRAGESSIRAITHGINGDRAYPRMCNDKTVLVDEDEGTPPV